VAVLRVLMVAFVFQTVVFASLWFYARARHAERLKADYLQTDRDVTLEAFVKSGLEAYSQPLKRKLVWGVYVIPTILLALFVYLTSSD
jgi:hypothetical protein